MVYLLYPFPVDRFSKFPTTTTMITNGDVVGNLDNAWITEE